mgnify:CR=1 FL=1
MVFTLTAAMLVGTPLTASAAGLVDLYQIEDGWGNVTGNEDNTRTGTVTATQTNSGILTANATLEGISLNESNIELEFPKEFELEASLDWNGTKNEELEAKLLKTLQWRSSNTAIAALRVENRSYNGGSRAKITVVPKAAGTANVTVSLDSKEYDIHYSATATVTVVQYADELKFMDELKEDAVTGNSLVLDEYVETYVDKKPVKTSDTLTYAIKGTDVNKIATLKNNVITFKKEGTISILAIGRYKTSGWYEITVGKGHNAKNIEFDGIARNKLDWVINKEGLTKDVTAKVTATKDGKKPCTDRISWSSKKPEIVAVSTTAPMKLTKKSENDFGECTVKLTAKSAGKAQIIAQASSGKKITLNVTVAANLSSIKIEEETKTLYSGQTIDLYAMADQYFGKDSNDLANKNFTDAGLKWTFVGGNNEQKPMKKVASLNANGVLNIKPDLSVNGGTKVIKVQAVNAKKVGENKPGTIKSNELTIDLKQVSVTKITVSKGATLMAEATAKDGRITQSVKGKTDEVAVDGSRVYTLAATGIVEGETAERVLDPSVLGWTASGNGKIVKASRSKDSNGVIKAVKKGTATITINSATKKGEKYVAIKTTFKAKVNAPTKTISLSVKNRGIAATGKRQTISITPVLQKGSTTNKNKDIEWTATKNGKNIDIDKGKIKNITLGESDLGHEIIVTAKVKNGGPRTSIRLTIVKPSKSVEFQQEGSKIRGTLPVAVNATENPVIETKINLTSSTSGVPGVDNVSGVTYTVNKAGIVRIIEKGEGKIEIEPLTPGTVKITAMTLDGKKGSQSIKVTP